MNGEFVFAYLEVCLFFHTEQFLFFLRKSKIKFKLKTFRVNCIYSYFYFELEIIIFFFLLLFLIFQADIEFWLKKSMKKVFSIVFR